jgi:hypothetical protein
MTVKICLGLFLLLATWPALGGEPETELRIEVTNPRGTAVERASVILRWDEGRSISKFGKKKIVSWEVRTNAEGVAKFPPLPQGKIRVQVIAKGYATFGEFYDINEPQKTIQVKLDPPQRQYSAH